MLEFDFRFESRRLKAGLVCSFEGDVIAAAIAWFRVSSRRSSHYLQLEVDLIRFGIKELNSITPL